MVGRENKGRRSRLAFLGTLASGLAHEIKNPLSAMSVNLQLLRDELEEAAEKGPREQRLLRRVTVLEREVTRLEGILDGFLRFARGYQLEARPHSLNALVRETVEFWAAKAAAAGIEVQLVLEEELPDALIDANYVKQALLNLLNNAFEALAERPAGQKDGREQILVCSRRAKNGVELLVIDNGPGIAADVRARIFDPYFSTKAGGSGLGLPTVRRIIEELGGSVVCESEPGRGTSFKLVLPAVAPAASEAGGPVAAGGAGAPAADA